MFHMTETQTTTLAQPSVHTAEDYISHPHPAITPYVWSLSSTVPYYILYFCVTLSHQNKHLDLYFYFYFFKNATFIKVIRFALR